MKWFIFPVSYVSFGSSSLIPSSTDAKGKTVPPVSETIPIQRFWEDNISPQRHEHLCYIGRGGLIIMFEWCSVQVQLRQGHHHCILATWSRLRQQRQQWMVEFSSFFESSTNFVGNELTNWKPTNFAILPSFYNKVGFESFFLKRLRVKVDVTSIKVCNSLFVTEPRTTGGLHRP